MREPPQTSPNLTLLVNSKKGGKSALYTTFKARESEGISPGELPPMALAMGRRALPNRVKFSVTYMAGEADRIPEALTP
jgi:hypothetical protein